VNGDVLAGVFDINIAIGLSLAEAAKQLENVGYNELPSAKPRSIFAIACISSTLLSASWRALRASYGLRD